MRHGLSLSVHFDPALSEEVEALARQIVGPTAAMHMLEFARQIAEAQIDLRRVRYARHQLLSKALSCPRYESKARWREKLALVIRCARVDGPFTPMPDHVVEFLNWRPEGPQKFAMVLSDKTRQLLVMERYERRALSRRKFAIRDFDIASQQRQRLAPNKGR